MKRKIIVIKNSIVISILLIAIIFFIQSLKYKKQENPTNTSQINQNSIQTNSLKAKTVEQKNPQIILPSDIDGFQVIGKLDIPSINLSTYILSETNDKTLNKSVTKLCGPNINEAGNFCILGHNYKKTNMFGNLRKVQINDVIILTNMYGQQVQYLVYDIFKVYPKQIEVLSQETYGNRDVTLITCTTGAIKRLIVRATEIYD